MKINQQSTSIECYYNIVVDFEASQNARVFDQIKNHGKITGHMISHNIGVDISSVGRSLNSLEKLGLIERPEELKDKCKITNIRVYYWRLKTKQGPGIQLTIK